MSSSDYRQPLHLKIFGQLFCFMFALNFRRRIRTYQKCKNIKVWKRPEQVISKKLCPQTAWKKLVSVSFSLIMILISENSGSFSQFSVGLANQSPWQAFLPTKGKMFLMSVFDVNQIWQIALIESYSISKFLTTYLRHIWIKLFIKAWKSSKIWKYLILRKTRTSNEQSIVFTNCLANFQWRFTLFIVTQILSINKKSSMASSLYRKLLNLKMMGYFFLYIFNEALGKSWKLLRIWK